MDLNDDDSLITSLIIVARQRAEEYTRRAFITQTWEWTLQPLSTPYKEIQLRPEVQAIINIAKDGETMDTSKYKLIGDIVHFDPSVLGSIAIRYTTGYGPNDNDVPESIKQAILQTVGHLYENRESQGIPPLAEDLLSFYKVWML